jgi:hypothetical protein
MIKIQIPIVIEMSDQQVEDYAREYGLPRQGGELRAKEVVDDVRTYVLTAVQDSAAFGETGDGKGTRGAEVSIRR